MVLNKTVSVIGLGYVGLPIAVAFSKKLHVIGFDNSQEKINMYKNGCDPTNEIGNKGVRECSVFFTSDPAHLGEASFHIVAVPTPLDHAKRPNVEYLESASRILGQNLKKGTTVVYESTVYPGITEEICVPILEKESSLICGRDFKIGYSPERINPGDPTHRLETIVKVVAGKDEETLNEVAAMYELVVDAGVYRAPSIKVAEAAKVIENSQRDLNIAFMNELSIIFNKMGIDTQEVLKAARTKWNFLDFRPGLVGGHCIGVDPYYLTYKAEQLGYFPQVILSGRRINDDMGRYVAENTVKKIILSGRNVSESKVAVAGLTFKENCPDIRNTRVVDMIKELKEYGINPLVCDPMADKEEVFAEYGITLSDISEIRSCDCIVFTVAHEDFKKINIHEFLKPNGVLIDVKAIFGHQKDFHYWSL
jgi:UDP-N-acetyl-D-galactosamine dehydrogenase